MGAPFLPPAKLTYLLPWCSFTSVRSRVHTRWVRSVPVSVLTVSTASSQQGVKPQTLGVVNKNNNAAPLSSWQDRLAEQRRPGGILPPQG